MLRVFIVLLLSALATCSPRSEEPQHSFRVYEENGITISETTGGSKYAEELFAYEKVLELKQDPQREESLLYRPNGLLMDADGNVYVEDEGSGRVAMFDPDGDYVRSFGRKGEGPGEFRSIDILGVRDEVLSVYDVAANRTTRFQVDGTFLDVTTVPVKAMSYFGASAVMAMYLEEDSRKVLIQRVMDLGPRFTHLQYRAIVLGAAFDTLWTVATPRLRTSYNAQMPAGTSRMIMGIQYGPAPAICFCPDRGILVSDGDKPELIWYALVGSVVRRICIVMQPEPVTAEERARILERYDRRIAETEGPRRKIYKAQKDALVIASEKPYWTNVLVDDIGFHWLLVSETVQDRREAGGNLYRVLSPEGEYLGDSRWPTNLAHARISHGHVLFIEGHDETGEQVPSVYRIRPAIEGLEYP